MKGIILAGGKGTRLFPLTINQSKHLLPVFNKPMIFYPLSTLILAGVDQLAVITTENFADSYDNCLKICDDIGIQYEILIQKEPLGVGHGVLVAKEFISGDSFWYMLGDNFFHGPDFGFRLAEFTKAIEFEKSFAQCFAYRVLDPSNYGVVVFDEHDKPIKLIEKPIANISNWAIPGLYFFSNEAVMRAQLLKPSHRGEIEITSLLESYLNENFLQVHKVSRGNSWFDLGTFESLLTASNFVNLIEARQGLQIGNPIEAAEQMLLISRDEARKLSNYYFNS